MMCGTLSPDLADELTIKFLWLFDYIVKISKRLLLI
uniref:Uncharacterized protein n=1 Tax=Rhizophora mucronata TaxID=61149 RepID=A0A2P2J3I0_RHIMU